MGPSSTVWVIVADWGSALKSLWLRGVRNLQVQIYCTLLFRFKGKGGLDSRRLDITLKYTTLDDGASLQGQRQWGTWGLSSLVPVAHTSSAWSWRFTLQGTVQGRGLALPGLAALGVVQAVRASESVTDSSLRFLSRPLSSSWSQAWQLHSLLVQSSQGAYSC
jgi:hypothetical protein